jgi:hypothetical protein
MADPLSNPRYEREIGVSEDVSQPSAIHGEPIAEKTARREPTARHAKLRYYITQMQGMLLDTQA